MTWYYGHEIPAGAMVWRSMNDGRFDWTMATIIWPDPEDPTVLNFMGMNGKLPPFHELIAVRNSCYPDARIACFERRDHTTGQLSKHRWTLPESLSKQALPIRIVGCRNGLGLLPTEEEILSMAYTKINLAAVLANAVRAFLPDPTQDATDEAQNAKIDALAASQAALTSAIATMKQDSDELRAALEARLDANDADDAALLEKFDGLYGELVEAASALAGDPDDDDDNGLVAEVQPVEGAPTSTAADNAIASAEG